MHLAILEKWEGDHTFTLMFQAPKEKEDECKRTLERLRKDAHKNKTPVEYKMIELDGEIEQPEMRLGAGQKDRKIIIPTGRYKGAEIYLERDVKEE